MATPVASQEVIYSDLDVRFLAHPATGKLIIRKNADAITQALKLLILTGFGERPFRNAFGSGVRQLLFENFSPIIETELKSIIRQAITNYEPRAIVHDILIDSDPDGNTLTVTIVYRPINGSRPITVSFDLSRTR